MDTETVMGAIRRWSPRFATPGATLVLTNMLIPAAIAADLAPPPVAATNAADMAPSPVAVGVATEAALGPRETARVRPERGAYSVGVFNPLTLNIGRGIEIQTHPLLFLIAPNLIVRVPHIPMSTPADPRWGLTGEYGLSVPTIGMRLLEGHLFPAWENHEGRIGWAVVPRVGAVASRSGGALRDQAAVISARADLVVGFPLSSTDAQPLDAPEPLNLLFDPVLSRYRGRVGVLWDSSLGRRWRVRAYGDLYVHGVQREFRLPSGTDNLTTRLGAGMDVGFGSRLQRRLTFGVAWWNSYQHAIDATTWQTQRSNDIWPMLDFIWER